jgi:hypothetical protein
MMKTERGNKYDLGVENFSRWWNGDIFNQKNNE